MAKRSAGGARNRARTRRSAKSNKTKPETATARTTGTKKSGGKRGPKPGTPSPLKVEISDELKADWKHRYEEIGESAVSIAAGAGFEETFVRRKAKEYGWVRPPRPVLGLSPAATLAAQAERLARLSWPAPQDNGDSCPPLAALAAGGETTGAAAFDGDLNAAARELTAAIRAQIAEIEALRPSLPTKGRRPTQASRAAHDLAMLSGAIQRLQGIGAPSHWNDDDDDNEDIDELRRRVAAKIQAFLDRRPDAGVAVGRDATGVEGDRS